MKPRARSEELVTRRSLLEWLGKATVLTLGADLLLACGDGGDGAESGSGEVAECARETVFPFAPGHQSPKGLFENTVDSQDLNRILRDWRLAIDGLVEMPLVLSFAELLRLDRVDQVTDFHCVERWSVLDVPWNGVHLSTLFDRVKPLPGATHVTFRCLRDVYSESLPLAEALEPRTLLAYGIACSTLPLKHGFPLRLVIPRKWGYKSAKYVYRVELTDRPLIGYWEKSGYPYEADVPPEKLREGKF